MARPVVAALMGGLGNQLFQYAAGRALAQARGAPLMLDLGAFARDGEPRRYALAPYAIDATPFPLPLRIRRRARVATAFPTWRAIRGSPGAGLRRLLSRHAWHPLPLVTEESFARDIGGLRPGSGAYLAGYWQSERFFRPIAAELRDTFRRPTAIDAANRDWLARIAAQPAICAHVRRGDYLQATFAGVHGVCSADYYKRALTLVRAQAPEAPVFVFSDDPTWARAHVQGEVVDANGPDQPAQELMLMAACRHHVIANSSLSWWAAWLGAAPGQVVVAPDPWFADGRATPDLLPQVWVTVPRE